MGFIIGWKKVDELQKKPGLNNHWRSFIGYDVSEYMISERFCAVWCHWLHEKSSVGTICYTVENEKINSTAEFKFKFKFKSKAAHTYRALLA